MKKIFISGKMFGLKPRKVIKNFNTLEENLMLYSKEKVSIMNPSVLLNMKTAKDFTEEDWLRVNFAMIDTCDCVYLLTNWEESENSKKEIAYAFKNKKDIYFPLEGGYYKDSATALKITVDEIKKIYLNQIEAEQDEEATMWAVETLKEAMCG